VKTSRSCHMYGGDLLLCRRPGRGANPYLLYCGARSAIRRFYPTNEIPSINFFVYGTMPMPELKLGQHARLVGGMIARYRVTR